MPAKTIAQAARPIASPLDELANKVATLKVKAAFAMDNEEAIAATNQIAAIVFCVTKFYAGQPALIRKFCADCELNAVLYQHYLDIADAE